MRKLSLLVITALVLGGAVFGLSKPGTSNAAPPGAVQNLTAYAQSCLNNGTVQVRLPQDPGRIWPATIGRAVPAAARELPSPALGTQGGGEIVLDPRDTKGVQALQSWFEFELALPDDMPHRQIGTRVLVRFEHAPEPLGWRLGRAVRRLFLSQFRL